MTWQEKAIGISALTDWVLCFGGPDYWYVFQEVEVKSKIISKHLPQQSIEDEDHWGELTQFVISQHLWGQGHDPQEAIEDHWRQLTHLEPHEYLVIHSESKQRRVLKWNGYLWEEVHENLRD